MLIGFKAYKVIKDDKRQIFLGKVLFKGQAILKSR